MKYKLMVIVYFHGHLLYIALKILTYWYIFFLIFQLGSTVWCKQMFYVNQKFLLECVHISLAIYNIFFQILNVKSNYLEN